MLWLLAPAALVVIWVLYSVSAAKKAARLVEEAAKTADELQAELDACREECRSEVSNAMAAYRDEILLVRLQAISMEELKKHAVGLRLQPLRDIGIGNLADLQGWSQGRLEGLRGVGPKSAATIPGIVQRLSSFAKSQPIADPEPPFLRDTERALVLAIYRELQCDRVLAKTPTAFPTLRSETDKTRRDVGSKTHFVRWMWSLGQSAEVHSAMQTAQETARSFEPGNTAYEVCEQVRALVSDCQSVRSNYVETTTLSTEYDECWHDFDVVLGRTVGNIGRVVRTPPVRLPRAETMTQARQVSPSTGNTITQGTVRTKLKEVTIFPKEGAIHSGVDVKPAEAGSAADANTSESSLDESKQQIRDQLQQYIDSIAPAKFDRKKDADDSELTTSRIGVEATVSAFEIPAQAVGGAGKDARWVAKNKSVVVQGVTIAGGMIFLSSQAGSPAPGVIYASLPARAGSYQPGGADMFWQGYFGLTPELRYHYLQWLADGASSKEFPHFAMFYFQGLERRLVQVAVSWNRSASDTNDVLREVQRITADFSGCNTSLPHYSDRLISFFELRSLPSDAPPDLDRPLQRSHELPWRLVYDLGRLAASQKPVPPALALRWLKVEPNYYPRTPATRCPEQFDALFLTLYVEKFGDGIVLPTRGKTLTFRYDPSNYQLRSKDLELNFEALPDAREWVNIRGELSAIANQATDRIDAYSRFCGRFPEKVETLQGALMLPREIWPEMARTSLEDIRNQAKDISSVEWDLFLERLGAAEPLASNQLVEIVRGLQAVGMGIEPDILEGARRPKAGERCTLFELTAREEPARTEIAYRNASLAVTLMACVAAADGHASDTEQSTATTIIASWSQLHTDHQARLKAVYRLHTQQPARLSSLKTRMLSMPEEDRTELLSVLTQMVTSDDVVSPAEVKFLEQVYTMLGVDQAQLYTALHKGKTSPLELSDSSVQLKRDAAATGFALDLRRIERLKAESTQVSQLLAEVFQEDEVVPPAAILSEIPEAGIFAKPAEANQALIWPQLGKPENDFLALLLTKPEWSRKELASAASVRRLMLDGTLEVINDASFDVLGEALLDGHDPIYVQTTLLENA